MNLSRTTVERRVVATDWIYRQRRRASHNADIWDLRFHREKYLNH
ncbi:transposase, partial [Escherichia coli]|nr:transposase [Escherichia coli]